MDLISVRLNVSEMFEEVTKLFPETLTSLITKECYIAGGVFKSLVLDETPNDWDFWFRNKESATKFLELYKELKTTKSCYLTNKDFLTLSKIETTTDNAITLKLPKGVIQFVVAEVGKPEDVIKTFDFLHTKCYYDPITGAMSCPTQNIINKKLKYTDGYHMPLNAMKRAIRFVKQGWDISDKEVDNIAKAIVGVDWKNPDVVKKQTRTYYKKNILEDEPDVAPTTNPGSYAALRNERDRNTIFRAEPPVDPSWGTSPQPLDVNGYSVGDSWTLAVPNSNVMETRTVTAIDQTTGEATITTSYDRRGEIVSGIAMAEVTNPTVDFPF